MVVLITSFLILWTGSAALVQFSKGAQCLGTSMQPSEHGPLSLVSCDSTAAYFDDAPDPLGSPQIASVLSDRKLCVNDDSIKCVDGNDMFLHACQTNDKKNIHKANHFMFDAHKQEIIAEFCGGTPMCLSTTASGTVQLGKCSGAGGWKRTVKPPPPTPPPSPWYL
jgi:hypothetical protein